jgi:hypothetical protein
MPGTPAALAANRYVSGLGRVRDACLSVGNRDSYGNRTVSKESGRELVAVRTVPHNFMR